MYAKWTIQLFINKVWLFSSVQVHVVKNNSRYKQSKCSDSSFLHDFRKYIFSLWSLWPFSIHSEDCLHVLWITHHHLLRESREYSLPIDRTEFSKSFLYDIAHCVLVIPVVEGSAYERVAPGSWDVLELFWGRSGEHSAGARHPQIEGSHGSNEILCCEHLAFTTTV